MVEQTGGAVYTTSLEGTREGGGVAARLGRLLPARQAFRYLLIGGWNSLFGYLCFAGFVALYARLLPPQSAWLTVLAQVSATPIGITMSFLTYKFLVFRTRGNYLVEWLRCILVYGTATLPGLVVLPVLTRGLEAVGPLHRWAPYVAGALVMGGTTVYTYFAHKNFSFAQPRKKIPAG